MDDLQFWDIIEAGGRKALDDQDRQLAAIRERLASLPPDQLEEFHRRFNQKMADAYAWDLWGAAYLINGGCSDDGFAYFRAWLISRGRAVYANAIRNPDSLGKALDPDRDDHEFEDLWGIARVVYEESTGEEMPDIRFEWPDEPKGERWDFDDDEEIARKLPKLGKLLT